MAYITLPQTERTKSGLEAFTEAFNPGLERAFQLALQRKMEEEQYRKTMERNKQMFPELFQEQVTPQGYEQLKPFMRGIDQGGDISPEVALKEAEGRATQKGAKIPKQYQFNREALQPGMQVKFDERGLPQFGYEKPDELTTANKAAQLQLTNKILENYEQGTAGNRIFRDINTGEEVDENTALMGMQEGRQYNVFLRTPTRSGSRETKIAEPPKLTETEKDFVGGYKQASKDIDSLIEQLTPQTKAPLGGFARISTRKRFLAPEPELRKLQEPYTRVIKTFLFGPAGKALTGTEREVLEMAVSPTGKSPEEWERDIVAAKQVLDDKYNLLTQRQYPVAQGQEDFSQISDEELRKIALGG